jgi:hypothetical protein
MLTRRALARHCRANPVVQGHVRICVTISMIKPMHLSYLLHLLAGLCLLASSLALADIQTHSRGTQAEVRVEHVRQTVLDILSYTRWPVEPPTMRLCVLGPTEYADNLFHISQQANGRRVTVSRYNVGDPLVPDHCDVLYLGDIGEAERLILFARLRGHALLSISEQAGPCSSSSVFCLQVNDDRVRFNVNLDALALSGVKVHPAVLKLGRAGEALP